MSIVSRGGGGEGDSGGVPWERRREGGRGGGKLEEGYRTQEVAGEKLYYVGEKDFVK